MDHGRSFLLLTFVAGLGSHCADEVDATSDVKIVGGEVTTANRPEAASTVYFKPPTDQRGCSATLVGARHGVTAAHCFAMMARGELVVGFGPSWDGGERRRINGFVIHPNWSFGSDGGDIAAFVFEGQIPEGFRPVQIGTRVSQDQPIVTAGYGDTASGRGDGGTLRHTQSTIVSINTESREFTLAKDGRGSCNGDSGGPAYAAIGNGELQLVGVVSRGNGPSCAPGDAVYTDPTRERGWLKCAFDKLGAPLDQLAGETDDPACANNKPNDASGAGAAPGMFPGGPMDAPPGMGGPMPGGPMPGGPMPPGMGGPMPPWIFGPGPFMMPDHGPAPGPMGPEEGWIILGPDGPAP